MTIVTEPILMRDTGPQVSNLIEVLLLLLNSGAISTTLPRPNKEDIARLQSSLKDDLSSGKFSKSMAELLGYFQLQHGLSSTGQVDAPTAATLNSMLAKLGAFDDKNARVIFGAVLDAAKSRIGGAQVVACAWDGESERILVETVSDAEGNYRLRLPDCAVRAVEFATSKLFVRALDGCGSNPVESDSLATDAAQAEVNLTLAGDICVVRGRVQRGDSANWGEFAPGVGAFAQTGIQEQRLLGETVATLTGAYRVVYSESALADATSSGIHLKISVAFAGVPPIFSPVLYHAARLVVLNFKVAGPPDTRSEYEKIDAAAGAMPLEFLHLETLDRGGIEFVLRDAGIKREQLLPVIDAARLRQATGGGQLPLTFFYGLVRAGLPNDLGALQSMPRSSVESALWRQVDDQVLPAAFRDQMASLLDQWDGIRASAAARRPALDAGISTSEVMDATLLPSGDLRSRAELLAIRAGGLTEAFFNDLSADPAWQGRPELPFLRKAAALAPAFDADAGALHAVAAQVRDRSDIQTDRDLVRLTLPEWQVLFTPSDPDAAAQLGADWHAKLDKKYLGDAAHIRIESGEWPLSDDSRRLYGSLADKYQGFRLADGKGKSLASVLQKEREGADATTTDIELLAIDALLRTAESSSDASDLLGAGFHSIGDIVDAGRGKFTAAMSGAGGVWTVDHADTLYRRFTAAFTTGTLLAGGRKHGKKMANASPRNTATLSGLMTEDGVCGCEACRSLLSQSAYLADLLCFLRDANPTNNQTPLTVLLGRCPWVQEVLFDCANEDTPIPHLDLVNEILERALLEDASHHAIALKRAQGDRSDIAALDGGALPGVIRTWLADAGIDLDLSVSVERTLQGNAWRLSDQRWVVDLVADLHLFPVPITIDWYANPWPQSAPGGDPDSFAPPRRFLRAYEDLDTEPSPWSLPFDLPGYAMRQVLDARGMHHADLVRVFASGHLATRKAIASLHRLLLPHAEIAELDNATPLTTADVARRWGFFSLTSSQPDPNPQSSGAPISGWINILSRVPYLLDVAGLTYDELTYLLETAFTNPSGAIKVLPVDPTDPDICDVRKLRLSALDEAALLAIYRFVRLSRRCGLDFGSLDALLTAAQASTWKATLVHLSDALALSAELGLEPRYVAAFWSDIGTREYTDPSAHPVAKGPSLYQRIFRTDPVLAKLLSEDPSVVQTTTYDEALAALAAALGLAISELPAWASLAGLSMTQTMTLAGLSALFRHAVLSHALGLALADYQNALASFGDPFGGQAAVTQQFTRQCKEHNGKSIPAPSLLPHALPFVDGVAETHAERFQKQAQGLWDLLTPLWADPQRQSEIGPMLLRNLAAYLRLTETQVETLTDGLAIDNLLVTFILSNKSNWPPSSSKFANPQAYPATRAIAALEQYTALLTYLGADPEWFRPPLLAPYNAWARVDQWAEFAQNLKLQPGQMRDYFTQLSQGNKAETKTALADILSVATADLDGLLGTTATGLWNIAFTKDYWTAHLASRLSEAKSLANKLGVEMQTLAGWFGGGAVPFADRMTTSDAVARAVGASLDVDVWAGIRRECDKRLRAERRSALETYIRWRENLGSPAQLFEKYLIYVEMSPETVTTRLAQAIFTTQLFIQRCVMGLEDPHVSFDDDDVQKCTTWLKWYRVWEANRELFLFTESYLDPDFRDDKTPLYLETEASLSQCDVTSEQAIAAFDRYLTSFHQITRLEMVSLLNEPVTPNVPLVTHLVARTRTQPATYFYRRRRKGVDWTAWEKIDADIQGDFVVPVIHGQRLELYWPVISEKSQTAADGTQLKMWQLQFARMRRTRAGWGTRESVADTFQHPQLKGIAAADSFVMRTFSDASTGDVKLLVFAAIPPAAPAPEPLVLTPWLGTGVPLEAVVEIKVRFRQQAGTGFGPGLLTLTDSTNSVTRSAIIGADGAAQLTLPGGMDMVMDLTITDSAGTDVAWTPGSTSQYDANTPFFYTATNVLYFRTRQYSAFTVPVLVAGTPSVAPTVAVPDVAWNPLGTLLISPSGRVEWQPSANGATLTPPQFSTHHGMGYRPFPSHPNELYLAPWIAPPISFTSSPNVTLFGSSEATGVQLSQATSSAAWESPIAISTPEGAWLGDFQVFGGIPFIPLHYSRDTRLLDYWSRFEQKALIMPDLQDPPTALEEISALSANPASAAHIELEFEAIAFDAKSPHSVYNWEIFVHIPWLIALRLSQNQRFAEAQQWFHLLFNPVAASTTGTDAWPCKPLREAVTANNTIFDVLADQTQLDRQVKLWEEDPFRPHVIARGRPLAFALALHKAYVENLFDWGDYLSRRNTAEAINEAAQIYMLASDVLGPRPPQRIGGGHKQAETFADFKAGDFDKLSNPIASIGVPAGGAAPAGIPVLNYRYFCIPENEVMLQLWDRLDSSLRRVRSGAARSLFGPPLDPALLARAAAMGIDLEELVDELDAQLDPQRVPYRYAMLAQKAAELCAEVKSLGSAFLSAIEKRDAEELSLVRARYETHLSSLQRDTRSAQCEQARAELAVLSSQRVGAMERLTNLRRLLNQEGLPAPKDGEAVARVSPIVTQASETFFDIDTRQLGLSQGEVLHLQWMTAANAMLMVSSGFSVAASLAHLIPDHKEATSLISAEFWGGSNIGSGLNATAEVFKAISGNATYQASTASTVSAHARRRDEWAEKHNTIAAEIETIDCQAVAATIRMQIAQSELDYQDAVVQNAEDMETRLRTKFTNQQMYNWMVGRLSETYFAAYRLAFGFAKAAETACFRELMPAQPLPAIVQLSYWDRLKEGLLAGDRLSLDLKRLDAEYMKGNARELEITRSISLLQLDPAALIALRLQGTCTFTIPEVLFDLDHADVWGRRIKSVSVSLPCVVGPYSGVPGKLSLIRSSLRSLDETLTDTTYSGGSIALSSAQSDSGLFETNLRDERYLPFEGAGAVNSVWKFELPENFRPFDYETISDLVLHLRYTAREGRDPKQVAAVRSNLASTLSHLQIAGSGQGLWRAFSLRHEYPAVWYKLMANTSASADILLEPVRFGLLFRAARLDLYELKVMAFVANPPAGLELTVSGTNIASHAFDLQDDPMQSRSMSLGTLAVPAAGTTLTLNLAGMNANVRLTEIILLTRFTVA